MNLSLRGFAARASLVCLLALGGEARSQDIYLNSDADGNWDIWSVRPDGSLPRRLTLTPWDEKDMALSPDRKRMAFASSDGYLKIMDLSRGRIVDSFATDPGFNFASQPAFLDSLLVFTHLADRERDISRLAAWGKGGLRELLAQKSSLFYPAPLPGGAGFLYTYLLCSNACGGFVTELWMHDARTRRSRQLTLLGGHIRRPMAWGAGKAIFAGDHGGRMGLYVIDLETRAVAPLVRNACSSTEPTPSPDGASVAYLCRRNEEVTLRVLAPATGRESGFRPVPGQYLNLAW